MEEMFNGFGQYQTYVKYVFGKASAIVKKVDDKYTITFDPNVYDLKNDYKAYNSEFRKIRPRIETSLNHDDNLWFVTDICKHFNNSTTLDSCEINIILNCIKNSVAFADLHDNGVKNTVPKVKLMTRDEMIELYNKKELTPAEISLKSWELKRAYTVQNKCTNMWDLRNGCTCALCYHRDRTTCICEHCSLCKVDKSCNASGSAYDKLDMYDEGKTEEFVKLIDVLIEKLKLAVELEKKEKENIVKPKKEKLKIIVTPVKDNKVTLDIENFKLAINTMKPKIYYLNLTNLIAIRNKAGHYIMPDGCIYPDRFDKTYIGIGPNNPMTIEAADEIIEGIKEAANHLHKVNHGECTGEHSCTDTIHRVHGVKITVKDVGCGRASISIDANGYDFDADKIRCCDNGSVLWRSYSYPEYEWFVDGHNLDFTPSNKFNNGYVNSKDIIDKIVTYSIESIKYNHSRGILKKQITEKQVIVV